MRARFTRSAKLTGSARHTGSAKHKSPAALPEGIAYSLRLGAAMLLLPCFAIAQDYIDVEAERRQQSTQLPVRQTLPGQTLPGQTPQQQGQGAVSYGAGSVAGTPSNVQSANTSPGVTVRPATAATTRTLPPPSAPAVQDVGGLFNQVQQLQQEVMRLNGLVEQQAYELRTLKEQSLERYMDIDRRLAGGAAAGPAARPSETSTASTVPRPAGGSSVAEQPGEAAAYQAAYALVRGQEFDEGVVAFKKFLQDYPAGKFAPNAHYWLGELYLVVDPADPEAARQSFMLLLNQYPDNSKIPDALYKLGRVQFMKGNSSAARDFLTRVVREYPSSSAARLAGDFIDQNL